MFALPIDQLPEDLLKQSPEKLPADQVLSSGGFPRDTRLNDTGTGQGSVRLSQSEERDCFYIVSGEFGVMSNPPS